MSELTGRLARLSPPSGDQSQLLLGNHNQGHRNSHWVKSSRAGFSSQAAALHSGERTCCHGETGRGWQVVESDISMTLLENSVTSACWGATGRDGIFPRQPRFSSDTQEACRVGTLSYKCQCGVKDTA